MCENSGPKHKDAKGKLLDRSRVPRNVPVVPVALDLDARELVERVPRAARCLPVAAAERQHEPQVLVLLRVARRVVQVTQQTGDLHSHEPYAHVWPRIASFGNRQGINV